MAKTNKVKDSDGNSIDLPAMIPVPTIIAKHAPAIIANFCKGTES